MNQDPNEEIHARTLEALQHAKEGTLTDDDLSLLAWHAGLTLKEVNETIHTER